MQYVFWTVVIASAALATQTTDDRPSYPALSLEPPPAAASEASKKAHKQYLLNRFDRLHQWRAGNVDQKAREDKGALYNKPYDHSLNILNMKETFKGYGARSKARKKGISIAPLTEKQAKDDEDVETFMRQEKEFEKERVEGQKRLDSQGPKERGKIEQDGHIRSLDDKTQREFEGQLQYDNEILGAVQADQQKSRRVLFQSKPTPEQYADQERRHQKEVEDLQAGKGFREGPTTKRRQWAVNDKRWQMRDS